MGLGLSLSLSLGLCPCLSLRRLLLLQLTLLLLCLLLLLTLLVHRAALLLLLLLALTLLVLLLLLRLAGLIAGGFFLTAAFHVALAVLLHALLDLTPILLRAIDPLLTRWRRGRLNRALLGRRLRLRRGKRLATALDLRRWLDRWRCRRCFRQGRAGAGRSRLRNRASIRTRPTLLHRRRRQRRASRCTRQRSTGGAGASTGEWGTGRQWPSTAGRRHAGRHRSWRLLTRARTRTTGAAGTTGCARRTSRGRITRAPGDRWRQSDGGCSNRDNGGSNATA